MKARYIALTDINNGIEIDDIQSLVRLLVYSNVIDIEGLINCTSCFVKTTGCRQEQIIHKHIDAYAKVKPSLDLHEDGFPSAEYLHSITASGIESFGDVPEKAFAHEKYNSNRGVQLIYKALQKDDERPLWFGLWGGANTLAQALWMVKQYLPEESGKIFSKVRIYGISDQDYAAKWIRKEYGDRLFYIVTPSDWTGKGSKDYYKATWPGISADHSEHGCDDGKSRTKGFTGADHTLINNRWIFKNIRRKGALGRRYPYTHFLTEGDTPSFLGLIPNGLNDPEHPEYGSWGGRYTLQKIAEEPFAIWTSTCDTVVGNDGRQHTSQQATVWRWRQDFQGDFASRMLWCVKPYNECMHPPIIDCFQQNITAAPGQTVTLSARVRDVDGKGLAEKWLVYAEAGNTTESIQLTHTMEPFCCLLTAPAYKCSVHIVLAVSGLEFPSPTRYVRFIVTVE